MDIHCVRGGSVAERWLWRRIAALLCCMWACSARSANRASSTQSRRHCSCNTKPTSISFVFCPMCQAVAPVSTKHRRFPTGIDCPRALLLLLYCRHTPLLSRTYMCRCPLFSLLLCFFWRACVQAKPAVVAIFSFGRQIMSKLIRTSSHPCWYLSTERAHVCQREIVA